MTVAVECIPLPAISSADKAGNSTLNSGLDSHRPALPAFLVGPENRLIKVVAENLLLPGSSHLAFNPIVLCGPEGCGKSRLVEGLTTAWQQRYASASVLRLEKDKVVGNKTLGNKTLAAQIENFASQNAQREKTLLVVEDLDRAQLTPTAQRQLELAIDRLLRVGGRLLVTSRTALSELKNIPARISSRLASGLIINLVAPEQETRTALITQAAQRYRLQLTEDATAELVQASRGHTVRQILQSVQQLAPLEDDPDASEVTTIDHQGLRRRMDSVKSGDSLSLRQIVAGVAKFHDLKVNDLRGRSRRRGIARARNMAMYIASRHGKHSLKRIGRYLDGRDHTTVMHGCRSIELQLSKESAFRQQVESLVRKLQRGDSNNKRNSRA